MEEGHARLDIRGDVVREALLAGDVPLRAGAADRLWEQTIDEVDAALARWRVVFGS